jgi:GntR family transcriptional regulator
MAREFEKVTSVSSQLDHILRSKILNGTYAADSHLPSEEKLAEELQVSRPTLRVALTKLEAEGLISRRQGHGTFVNKHVISVDAKPKSYWDFPSMIESSGRVPSIRTVSVEKRTPIKEEIEAHGLSPKEKFMVLGVVYLANDHPVIYSTALIPYKLFNTSENQYDFNRRISVYLKDHTGQEIAYSISDISPTFAPLHIAAQLEAKPDTPMIQFVDIFYNLQNEGLLYGISYFHDKVIRLRVAHSWG